MNAWGLIIIAIGVGILWWAKQQTGSLDDIIGDITKTALKPVTKIPAAVKTATTPGAPGNTEPGWLKWIPGFP